MERFLFLLPASPLGYRSLEADPVPHPVSGAYETGLRGMLNWPAPKDDGGRYALKVSEDARQEWLSFAKKIELAMRPGGDLEHMTGWAGKLPGQAARLAAVLHGAEHAHGRPWEAPVSLKTMQ